MDEDTEVAAWAQLELEQELRADPAYDLWRTSLEQIEERDDEH